MPTSHTAKAGATKRTYTRKNKQENAGSQSQDFLGFYHIHVWTLQPCWSCDPDHLINFSFLKALETVYEIWVKSTQQFQRSCLKLRIDRQADDVQPSLPILLAPGACGSGELKCQN